MLTRVVLWFSTKPSFLLENLAIGIFALMLSLGVS
jgi:hypothetical protein